MYGYHEIRCRVFEVEEEEAFALRWLNMTQIPLATRFTYILEVYGDKLMEEKRKGKMKKVIDFEEEDRQFQKDLIQEIRASLMEQQRALLQQGEVLSNLGGQAAEGPFMPQVGDECIIFVEEEERDE